MSWAAHQFEVYAIQAHLPKKMIGRVSFWAIFLGDFTPDFLGQLSVDRLRHIFLAMCLQNQHLPEMNAAA